MSFDDMFLPLDPIAAVSGLAVGQPFHSCAEGRADRSKDILGGGQGHAADDENVA